MQVCKNEASFINDISKLYTPYTSNPEFHSKTENINANADSHSKM